MKFIRKNRVKNKNVSTAENSVKNYFYSGGGGAAPYDDTVIKNDIRINAENINLLMTDFQGLSDELNGQASKIAVLQNESKTHLSKTKDDVAAGKITFQKGIISDKVISANYEHGNGFGLIREGDNSKFTIGGATEKIIDFHYANHQETPTESFLSRKFGISTIINVTVETNKAFLRFKAITSLSDYTNMHFNSKTVQYYINNDKDQKHDAILIDGSTYQIPLPSGNNDITILLFVDYSNKPTEKIATMIMTLEGLLPETEQSIIYGVTKTSTLSPTGLVIIEEQRGIWFSIDGIKHSLDGGQTWT